ncbi:MAG: glycosyltransferase family 9 protein [Proteobacteria bacterium]|nr:glycosyltransferase family 9 protein [Pseudomonadota bacterium]MBU1611296.1 glycosyltransferase family 9 protein [Pseudomonadota bacterium]
MNKPILVLQMQRMGDLILSFPLFLWLEREFPGREIWVLAEKAFSKPLMPISPKVTYFPWEGTQFLLKHEFELVLNLSIREEAALLAGQVRAGAKFGPVQDGAGRYVRGAWQLYRASLVRNNRFNRFHWADLNALDVIPLTRMAKTVYSPPRTLTEDKPQVGLFLGASDPAKRPAAAFWAQLCAELVERSIRPALFGGPAEKELGAEVVRLFGRPVANFCGSFGLDQLTRAMHTLALFVSPDTGPMHLAAWTACHTLNLSMGNVNPWETGPFTPGHAVLRADISCAPGCWECTRDQLYCHFPFDPPAIAALITRIAKSPQGDTPTTPPPGLTLATTDRTDQGVFHLHMKGTEKQDEHGLIAAFWHAFFGWRLKLWGEDQAVDAARTLAARAPEAASSLAAPLPGLFRDLKAGLTRGRSPELWERSPEIIRPLTGWAELHLRNEDASPEAFKTLLESLEALRSVTAD